MKKFTPVGTFAIALLLTAALLLNSGCEVLTTGAVVGTPAVDKAFTNQGDFVAILHGDYDTIVRSTHGAMGRLALNIPDENNNDPVDTFVTTNSEGTPISIIISRINQATTQVTIHVGHNGNEYYSRNILAAIQQST